jgi:hypothetical protein
MRARLALTTSKGYLGSETSGLYRCVTVVVACEKYLLEDVSAASMPTVLQEMIIAVCVPT